MELLINANGIKIKNKPNGGFMYRRIGTTATAFIKK